MTHPDFDMIIVGAGISGICAAVHFSQKCEGMTYAVLEARDNIGGTWDLFKYPGIRSDSDMQTFGYKFKPWKNPKSIADAPSILEYLNETVDEFDIRRHIQFGQKVMQTHWSSERSIWTVEKEDGSQQTCRFLFMCAGYYDYDNPHNPTLTGEDAFKGQIVHPQFWRDDIDYKDKNVVVIGSGATAVTLIPSMAKTAKHVTMLQRSPTWIASRPSKDKIANSLRAIFPEKLAYKLTRAKNIWYSNFVYKASLKNPEKMKKELFKMTRQSLDLPKGAELPADYIPSYNPWTQRLCLVPDNDLYESIKAGEASIITDHIETITEAGIQLKSGQHLDCDLIVKATGITVTVFSKGQFVVDGETVDFSKTFTYEGMMFSDVPNMASIFGYINASWTLRADLIAEYFCRVINHMAENDLTVAIPRAPEGMEGRPWITTFDPGYITRVLDALPMQGDRDPWLNAQDYKRDRKVLSTKPIDDGHIEFLNGPLKHERAAE